MKKTIAVFDVDRTIIKGTSCERLFVDYLRNKGVIGFSQKFSFAKRFIFTIFRNKIMATKGNKYYLKGLEKQKTDEMAKEFFNVEIIPRISEDAVKKIEEHRKEGMEIVLLSGTLEVLMKLLQKHLNVERVHCSDMEIVEGKYTGDIIGKFPFGSAKADIIRMNYSSDKYDLSASYAYGDHPTDLGFLQVFGHGFIVNPDAKLEQKAKKKGVGVVRFE